MTKQNQAGFLAPAPLNDFELRGSCALLILKRRDGKTWRTVIDKCDLPLVAGRHWTVFLNQCTGTYYAKSSRRATTTYLHRLLMGEPSRPLVVDHINHDTLDNRRCNLRVIRHSDNLFHRRAAQSNSASGVRGVRWCNLAMKWIGQLNFRGKNQHVGMFDTKEDAAVAVAAKIAEFESLISASAR